MGYLTDFSDKKQGLYDKVVKEKCIKSIDIFCNIFKSKTIRDEFYTLMLKNNKDENDTMYMNIIGLYHSFNNHNLAFEIWNNIISLEFDEKTL